MFRQAREAGFLTFAHAGEEGPAEYVRQAVDLLGVSRIDHGNRALEDPALVQRLAREGVPLTVCPLSNLRLGGVDDLARHPLKRMLDAGLMATVNSDDPAYFGGYLMDNYIAVCGALGLGRGHVISLARNSINASFAAPVRKGPLARRNRRPSATQRSGVRSPQPVKTRLAARKEGETPSLQGSINTEGVPSEGGRLALPGEGQQLLRVCRRARKGALATTTHQSEGNACVAPFGIGAANPTGC